MIIISVIVFDDWPWHAFSGADPSVRENIDQSLMVNDQESKYQRRSPYKAALRAGVSSSIPPSSVTVITSSGDLWQGRQELNDYHLFHRWFSIRRVCGNLAAVIIVTYLDLITFLWWHHLSNYLTLSDTLISNRHSWLSFDIGNSWPYWASVVNILGRIPIFGPVYLYCTSPKAARAWNRTWPRMSY